MEEIEELIVEEDRPEHIAKHKIKISEVRQVISANYTYIKGKLGRWLLIGQTKKKRLLTIVVGTRRKKGVYGLVTARPASREEKKFFSEAEKQKGDKNGKNKKS